MKRIHEIAKRCLTLLLTVIMCVLLGACRESPVLQEILYMSAQPEIDEEQTELTPEDEGEENEQFEHEIDEQADLLRQEEDDSGLAGEENEVSHDAGVDYSASAVHDWEGGGSDGDTAQNGTGDAPMSDTVQTENGDGTDVSPENVAGADNDTAKQVVDGAGRTVSLPESVETVAAVRWAAQMTEMLGGSGRLIAADSEFLNSALARAAFPDLTGVSALWLGDGSQYISASDFEALLAMRPDVCFEISGDNTFTNDQIVQLEEAGTAYVVLPKLNSTDNLETALDVMAQILTTNDSTGESAGEIAGAYVSWIDSTLSSVNSKISGTARSSLYIAGWDPDAQYILNNTHGIDFPTGLGLAYAYSPLKTQILSTFMSAVNISNESTRIANLYRDTDYLYVTPMFQQFMPTVSGKMATYYDSTGKTAASKELFVSRNIGGDSYYELGDSAYPAIIAANKDVKEQIEENFYWQAHELTDTGYYVANGMNFYHGVAGPYDIYVMPQGMLDWAEGSLESPLTAYWLACQFDNAYTLDEVKAQTQSFYQKFFRLSLSEQQLDMIFAGSAE